MIAVTTIQFAFVSFCILFAIAGTISVIYEIKNR